MIDLYKKQKDFFDTIRQSEYSDKDHIHRIKDYGLGITRNVADVINALDWDPSKEHKSNSLLHQKVEAVDAAVDIMKYAWNICLEFDITPQELVQRVQMKNRTVEQKFKQRKFMDSDKFKNANYAFIIDIDGVLADIVTAYNFWFSSKTGIAFETYDQLQEWKTENIDLYREIKEEYRLSGYKMIMPAVEGARELLRLCHGRGIVSLLTNRPVKSYPILYMYTVEWLHNRGMIQWVDMIHFTALGEKRYFFDRFLGKEVYFLEDNVYNLVNTIERPNVCNLFIRNETNKRVETPAIAVTASDLLSATEFIKDITDDEKHNHRWEPIRRNAD